MGKDVRSPSLAVVGSVIYVFALKELLSFASKWPMQTEKCAQMKHTHTLIHTLINANTIRELNIIAIQTHTINHFFGGDSDLFVIK